MTFFNEFGKKWASEGSVEPISETQKKSGWDFLGSVPPISGQFNLVQQNTDEKINYLFNLINSFVISRGGTLNAVSTNALRDILNNLLMAVQGGHVGYATKDGMLLDTTQEERTIAEVLSDPVAENNGFYLWLSGEWVKQIGPWGLAMAATDASRIAAEEAAADADAAKTEAQTAAGLAVDAQTDIHTNWQGKLDIAAQYATDVEEIKTEIRNWYYGAFDIEPMTRPDGTAIEVGDEYHDAVNHVRKVYSNGVWQDVSAAALAMPGGAALVGFRQDGAGAVARTTQDKLRDFVSVKDFGAVGDGEADDTDSVQAAINSSRKVFLPPGTYLITSKIILKNNSFLVGSDATLLNKFSSVYNVADNCLFGEGISNVVIEGLIIDGGRFEFQTTNGTDTIAGNSLIKFSNCRNITLKNCWWKNYTQAWGGTDFHVVRIINSDGVQLFNNRQSDVYPEGARIDSCRNVTVDGFTVENTQASIVWTPLHLFFCDIVIAQNIYLESASTGSTFNFTCSNFVIRNVVLNGGSGLDVSNETATPYQLKNGLVENVLVNGGLIYGVPINGGPMEDITISNCVINRVLKGSSSSDNCAIRIGSPINVKIIDCQISIDRGSSTIFTSLIRADILENSSNGLFIDNVVFTGDVDVVVQINPNDIYKNFKGLRLSKISGALTRNATQGSFTGNGSLIVFASSLLEEDPESYLDDLTIKDLEIENITGSICTIYNAGYVKNVYIERSNFNGNNDRSMPFPVSLVVRDSKFNLNLFVGGSPNRLDKFTFEDNYVDTPIDPSSFINFTTVTEVELHRVNIKNNSINNSRFINITNANVKFNPIGCNLDFDLNLVSGTSAGHLAARNFVMRSGAFGKHPPSIYSSTTNRVTSPMLGQSMFDSTIGKPIWWNGLSWVDASGAIVVNER